LKRQVGVFDNDKGNVNIVLENKARLSITELDNFGEDLEKTSNGCVDYLLLDNKGFPIILLEAKKESINPLSAKEQARKYAQSQNCRFIILFNENLHYLWDLQRRNPNVISKFPKPETIIGYTAFKPRSQHPIQQK
jgi:type I restriction enzyme R subunit